MRFRIDLKIFLFLLLFYFTRQIEIYVIMIFFVVVHELGHLLMGLMLKMKPERIELMPFGLSISFKVNVQDINKKRGNGNQQVFKEILVASAGPLTNLIILIFTYVFFGNFNFSSLVIYANLLILIFNLLPIYPLDGGRILNGILHILFGRLEARRLSFDISMVVTIVLTAVSSIGILYFHNIAIFLIVLYVWLIVLKENIIYSRIKKLYQNMEKIE